MRKFALFLISFLFILTAIQPADITAKADNSSLYDPYIKVGLYYGTNALPSANLANEVGSGYNFGFFDKELNFCMVGSTVQEKITVNKDKNMYMLKGTYYDALPPAGALTIGAYHIDSGVQYSSYDEAVNSAKVLTENTGIAAFPAYII